MDPWDISGTGSPGIPERSAAPSDRGIPGRFLDITGFFDIRK